MTHRAMLDAHPGDLAAIDLDRLADAIAALQECAQVCTACADACLSEEMVADLRRCIRSDLDCADVCQATLAVLTRRTGYDPNVTRAVLEACVTVCLACAEECGDHAGMHEHCRICADVCRRCVDACRALAESLTQGPHH